MISLLFILIGAVVGLWHGRVDRRGLALAQDILLQALLFFTSATFGANPAVRDSLGTLGAASLLTATLAVAASMLAGSLWGRRFDRTGIGAAVESLSPVSAGAQSVLTALMALTAVSVITGWMLGVLLAGGPSAPRLSTLSTFCLNGLLLAIGYDLGRQRIWLRMAGYGPWSLTLPLVVGIASLAGAAIAGAALGLPVGRSLSAGSGFGWYSLAGAVALEVAGAEVGAYVFLSSLFRELLTVLVAPALSGRVGPAAGAAMGGATSMDSTLPTITRSFGPMGTVWGLITGTTLSLATPFLLNVFLRLPL